jgi:menaquinone-dependent protoporphyrinogen oxidase
MTCDIPVFYATTEGQTRKIALYLADRFRSFGFSSSAIDVNSHEVAEIDWAHVRGAVVGASIHIGKHQHSAVSFVRAHRDQLNERPSAFFSVSLSAGSAQPREVAAAAQIARDFIERTRWYADHVVCIAGCLAYTKYGWLKRWLLRRIAKQEGASTDVSRDHEYTDWKQVDQLADRLAQSMRTLVPQRGAT